MAKFGKWIGGGLGWALGGPIGGILGFVLGSVFDGTTGSSFQAQPGYAGTATGYSGRTTTGG